jgi:hypothetical protein
MEVSRRRSTAGIGRAVAVAAAAAGRRWWSTAATTRESDRVGPGMSFEQAEAAFVS